MKRVLVTGFEPFGGDIVNPALEVIKELQKSSWEQKGIILFTQEIPTVFGESIQVLKQTIQSVKPDLVVSVGQAGGRSEITVERVAINVDDARIPDNAGQQPIDLPVIPGGPVAYWSTLPIKAMVAKMQEAGIPASVSHSAGTFVCNHIFYGLAHLLATEFQDVRGGFVHIPFLPSQAAKLKGQPSMSLETLRQGMEVAIETAVHYQTDLVISGGGTH